MSLTKRIDVVCPSCGSPQKFKLWESLNVEIDPAEKENLLSGEICTLRCESCGEESPIEHDLLYHDPEKKLLIQLRYEESEEDSTLPPAIESLSAVIAQGYRLRVVKTFKDLVEKVLIFDDRLDDRVLEVLKSQSWRQVLDLMPESEPPSDEIYYQELISTSDGGKELIFAVITQEDIYPVCVPHKAGYLHTLALIMNALAARPDEKSKWLVVDRAYAARVIGETYTARWAKPRAWMREPLRPGAVRWQDENGRINQAQVQPGWLQNALRSGQCKLVYRVLVKDPIYHRVQEDFWELTDDQVAKFVDADQTAYCAVSYVKGEQKLLLVAKPVWDTLVGWQP
jgi:hypothetical protein